MEKFKAKVVETPNDCISYIIVKEIFSKEDSNGYNQKPGGFMEHTIEIEGNNSYKRAKLLAKKINSRQK